MVKDCLFLISPALVLLGVVGETSLWTVSFVCREYAKLRVALFCVQGWGNLLLSKLFCNWGLDRVCRVRNFEVSLCWLPVVWSGQDTRQVQHVPTQVRWKLRRRMHWTLGGGGNQSAEPPIWTNAKPSTENLLPHPSQMQTGNCLHILQIGFFFIY